MLRSTCVSAFEDGNWTSPNWRTRSFFAGTSAPFLQRIGYSVYIYTYIHIRPYIYIYVGMYVCMYVYILICKLGVSNALHVAFDYVPNGGFLSFSSWSCGCQTRGRLGYDAGKLQIDWKQNGDPNYQTNRQLSIQPQQKIKVEAQPTAFGCSTLKRISQNTVCDISSPG